MPLFSLVWREIRKVEGWPNALRYSIPDCVPDVNIQKDRYGSIKAFLTKELGLGSADLQRLHDLYLTQ